ncbi:TPA: VWA domain-containing protein [Candidatus Bathyarchaeota archaeon]|nr:VWA domain-containing protein [Candidatus Bathyarchaeota archaeon]
MKFYDSAWFISYELTGREPGEIRILVRDSIPFPFIQKDDYGFVICLPNVKKLKNRMLKYQGILFDPRDETQIQILWDLFKSSIYYLSLFTVIVNPKVYSDQLKGKDENTALASIVIVEDAVLNAYLKTFHPELLPEMKIADAFSYLTLKPAHLIRNRGVRLAASILSFYKTGMIKGRLDSFENVKNAVNMLRRLERRNIKAFSKLDNRLDAVKAQEIGSKMKVFSRIYELLSNYSSALPEVPSFPYMNHLSRNSIFEGNLKPPSVIAVRNTVNEINQRLGLKIDINYEFLKNEASQNYWDWIRKEKKSRKILSRYREVGQKTRFKDFVFPEHDYAEFLRRRAVHSKTIRRITNRLALYYNLTGEDFRRETGIIDLQEAIQVIASQQQRSDIFREDTLRYRAQAWSILVDVSLSLESFAGEVKDVILCLTEVSRKLFPNNRSLGVFAFDDKFYIIKDFVEKHNRTVCARIGGIKHSGMTYLADGIKMVTESLKRRYEESKILIVISDGFPMGYRGAAEDAKEQIIAALRSGINVIGIGIDSIRVKDYFPVHCIVRTPYELMKKFVDTFFSYSSMM